MYSQVRTHSVSTYTVQRNVTAIQLLMTRQYVETAAVAAAAAVMVMKMAALFLPSFLPSVRLSLTMQMIQEKIAGRADADGRTNEGTSLVPPRRRKELFKATLAARTKYVASERTEGTDGHRRAVKQAAKIGTERREKARKVFSHETERRTTREHGARRTRK